MADDMVTRLLAYHPATCAACDIWGGCGYGEPCDCVCHQHPCAEAAAEIARLRDEIEWLRTNLKSVLHGIDNLLEDIDAYHQPEWASEESRLAAEDPLWCRTCKEQDGFWPCVHRAALNELKAIRYV